MRNNATRYFLAAGFGVGIYVVAQIAGLKKPLDYAAAIAASFGANEVLKKAQQAGIRRVDENHQRNI